MVKNRSKAEAAEGPEDRAGARRGLMQQEIYEQATRLFAQRGYAGTNFQDIADAVGLTRPALYHYVKSKDELLARLVAEITVVAATDIAALAKRDELNATEKLREIVRLLVRRQGEQGERFRLLLRSEADLPETVASSYEVNRRAVLRSLTEVIEQGVVGGEFRAVAPPVAALGTLGIVNWVAWWYHPGSRYDLDAVCEELADMAVHALAAERGRPGSTTPLDAVRSIRREVSRLEKLLKQS